MGPEEGEVEIAHGLEVGSSEDNVRELVWADSSVTYCVEIGLGIDRHCCRCRYRMGRSRLVRCQRGL